MAAPRLEQAAALVADCAAALTAAGLTRAVATMDATKVPSGARYGVVVVSAPTLTFPTFGDPDVTWEVHVVAGPATDYLRAWDTIDLLIEALHTAGLNLAGAEPGAFQPLQGAPLPAYTLTLNPLD